MRKERRCSGTKDGLGTSLVVRLQAPSLFSVEKLKLSVSVSYEKCLWMLMRVINDR